MAVTGTVNSRLQSVQTPTAGTVPSHLSTRSLRFSIPRVSHSNRRVRWSAGIGQDRIREPRLSSKNWTRTQATGHSSRAAKPKGRAWLQPCHKAANSTQAPQGTNALTRDSSLTLRNLRRTVLLPPEVDPGVFPKEIVSRRRIRAAIEPSVVDCHPEAAEPRAQASDSQRRISVLIMEHEGLIQAETKNRVPISRVLCEKWDAMR